MKSYFLHQHKIPKLHLLFITTIIVFILSANISYGDIDVELLAVETAQYPTINAYVTVEDENGNPITELNESNFLIFEDGNAQTAISVSPIIPSTDLVAVALSLDYSGSMEDANAIEDMETAALLFIEELRSEYDDACEIIKFDWRFEVEQEFTTNKEYLRNAIEKEWTTDHRGTKLYDTVYKATENTALFIESLEGLGGVGNVVVISDGKDYNAITNEQGSEHSLDDIISLAASNDIKIFTIGIGDVNAEVLERMAYETGGIYFYAPTPDDLVRIYLAIASKFYGGYIVSYETSATGCQYHELRIRVTKNGDSDEDTQLVLICPSNGGGGGSSGFLFFDEGGGGCSMSNPEGQINISHPVILLGIFALGLLVWRKRRRR